MSSGWVSMFPMSSSSSAELLRGLFFVLELPRDSDSTKFLKSLVSLQNWHFPSLVGPFAGWIT